MELLHLYVLVGILVFLWAGMRIGKIHKEEHQLLDEKDFLTKFIEFLERELNKRQSKFDAKTYIQLILGLCLCLGTISYLLTANAIMSVVLGLFGVCLPEVYHNVQNTKKQEAFEKEYVQALAQLSSALKAGMTIEQAVDSLCTNYFLPQTIRERFMQISADLKIGISMEEAFLRFAKNCGSQDAWDVAAAVSMQSKVGGQESILLDSIIRNVNNRIAVRKEVKTELSETETMVNFFDVMPIVFLIILCIGMQNFILQFFASAITIFIFIFLLCMIAVGTLINRKMLNRAKHF